MAKRGPKGVNPSIKKARGTDQPCRKVEVLFADHAARPDPDHIAAPAWMNKAAKGIWDKKVDLYRKRGQKIDGFQDALAQYCMLEAQLIAEWKAHMVPKSAFVTQYRYFASEFYDTPASQKVPASGGNDAKNKFTKNGQRPAT